jgi:hypothetical protein
MRLSCHPEGELRLKRSLPHDHKAATGKRPWVLLGIFLNG